MQGKRNQTSITTPNHQHSIVNNNNSNSANHSVEEYTLAPAQKRPKHNHSTTESSTASSTHLLSITPETMGSKGVAISLNNNGVRKKDFTNQPAKKLVIKNLKGSSNYLYLVTKLICCSCSKTSRQL